MSSDQNNVFYRRVRFSARMEFHARRSFSRVVVNPSLQTADRRTFAVVVLRTLNHAKSNFGFTRRGKRSELDPERSAVLSPMFLLKCCSSVLQQCRPGNRIRVNVLGLWVVIQFRGAKMCRKFIYFHFKTTSKKL